MTGVLTTVSLAILLGWAAFFLAAMVTGARTAAIGGLALGLICAVALRNTVVLDGAVALIAPFGVMLPALALRHVAARLGLRVVPFGTGALFMFLLAYLLFLASAMGLVPVDVYRLGYAPGPVATMVLLICAWGMVTGDWFLPLVAVLGQLGWVMGWGSSNWFDTVTHAALGPLIAVVLMARLLSARS